MSMRRWKLIAPFFMTANHLPSADGAFATNHFGYAGGAPARRKKSSTSWRVAVSTTSLPCGGRLWREAIGVDPSNTTDSEICRGGESAVLATTWNPW
jgi:hypothetical protein